MWKALCILPIIKPHLSMRREGDFFKYEILDREIVIYNLCFLPHTSSSHPTFWVIILSLIHE